MLARTTVRTFGHVPKLSGGEPLYRRLANDLKARIDAGEFGRGRQLPREESLAAEYGVSRGTVRRAIQLLRYEDTLHVRHGHGTFVRQHEEPELVPAPPGAKIAARLPTLHEQQELEISEVTPVLVVIEPDGSATAYPADSTMVQVPWSGAAS